MMIVTIKIIITITTVYYLASQKYTYELCRWMKNPGSSPIMLWFQPFVDHTIFHLLMSLYTGQILRFYEIFFFSFSSRRTSAWQPLRFPRRSRCLLRVTPRQREWGFETLLPLLRRRFWVFLFLSFDKKILCILCITYKYNVYIYYIYILFV